MARSQMQSPASLGRRYVVTPSIPEFGNMSFPLISKVKRHGCTLKKNGRRPDMLEFVELYYDPRG